MDTRANKGARRYRYYVEDVVIGKAPRRLAAGELEAATLAALRAYLMNQQQLVGDLGEVSADQIAGALHRAQRSAELLGQRLGQPQHAVVRDVIAKVRYRDAQLELEISRTGLHRLLEIRQSGSTAWPTNADPHSDVISFRAPVVIRRRGPQMKMVVAGPDNLQPDTELITAVVRARRWAERLTNGEAGSVAQIAAAENRSAAYISRILPLAYLAPRIVEDILSGQSSPGLLDRARPALDLSWQHQIEILRLA